MSKWILCKVILFYFIAKNKIRTVLKLRSAVTPHSPNINTNSMIVYEPISKIAVHPSTCWLILLGQ